jgi:NitT/TauT family transport system ATP-binding protein
VISPSAAPQLRLERIDKEFPVRGSRKPLRVLDGIELEIEAGEFVVLLGPSGCGKSTLLNLVAGFMRPSGGRMLHDGVEIRAPDRRRTVVFQDYALFAWMTVQKNVEFGLKAQGVGERERAEIARRFLSLVKLTGFEDRYPHEISGGMKQRAAIARALAPNPDVLLMDEPFGALDAQTRVLLQEEVARISAETSKTVLFVTHSIDEAVFLADRIVVMSAHPGRVRGIYNVTMPKPRTSATRALPEFIALTQELWESLKPQWQETDAYSRRPAA